MEVLAGASHEARDQAFGNYLASDIQLLWASGRIESRAQALAAQAQFLAIDLRKLRTCGRRITRTARHTAVPPNGCP